MDRIKSLNVLIDDNQQMCFERDTVLIQTKDMSEIQEATIDHIGALIVQLLVQNRIGSKLTPKQVLVKDIVSLTLSKRR